MLSCATTGPEGAKACCHGHAPRVPVDSAPQSCPAPKGQRNRTTTQHNTHIRVSLSMLTTLLTLVLATTTLVGAGPPDLECLSDLSFNDAYTRQSVKRVDDPIVILVGDPDDPSPEKTWAVWNDPAVLKYLRDRELLVTYLDENTGDQQYLKRFRPETVPMVIYFPGNRGTDHRLAADQLPTRADLVVDWLKRPEREKQEFRMRELDLLNRIACDPSDVGARLDLIELRSRSGGRSVGAFSLLPWLLMHNEDWFTHERMISRNKLTEGQFRSSVFNEIMVARHSMNLFKDASSGYLDVEHDLWIDRIERERTGFWSGVVMPEKGMQWQWSRTFKPYAESIKAGEGTERDRFILHALTAEGEQWQELIEQYSDDSP